MSINLSALFPSFQLLSYKPERCPDNVFLFLDPIADNYISIHKEDVSSREYGLLSAIFQEIEISHDRTNNPEQKKWLNYLDGLGPSPLQDNAKIRSILISFPTDELKRNELKEAINAFFGEEMILLFPVRHHALLIEKKSSYVYGIEDFSSFSSILEGDFFIKPKIYIGKYHDSDSDYPAKYQAESVYFSEGLNRLPKEQIFTMEKIFPLLLIDSLSDNMKNTILHEILIPIDHDEELLKTVQYFFENGFNGSTTSEKLHIHRNTLNYRLTKFQDITGISVRNFSGALAAYFASLLAFE